MKVGREYFLKEYDRISEDAYDDHPIMAIEAMVSDVSGGFVDLTAFRDKGYQILEFREPMSRPAIISFLEPYFGAAVLGGYARKSLQTTIKAEKRGVYFANGTDTQPLHMDDAYMLNPPRIITLLCERQSARGGVSTLLAFDDLYENVIKSFGDDLSPLFEPTALRIHGMKGQVDRPLLERLPEGRIGMTFPSILSALECRDDVFQLYDRIMAYIHEPAHQIRFRLKDGQLLLIDNFRMFHGRTKFSFNDPRVLVRTSFSSEFFTKDQKSETKGESRIEKDPPISDPLGYQGTQHYNRPDHGAGMHQ